MAVIRQETQESGAPVIKPLANPRFIGLLVIISFTITALSMPQQLTSVYLQKVHHLSLIAEEVHFGYVAVTDELLCNGCRDCLDTCYFEARQLKEGTIHLIKGQCFGCGRCIEDCSQEAIRLEIDPSQSHPFLAHIGLF